MYIWIHVCICICIAPEEGARRCSAVNTLQVYLTKFTY